MAHSAPVRGQRGPGKPSAYQALARDLRTALLRQEYPDGVPLPTEAELAARHKISRQTVRRAFQDLVAEGIVYRVPGRGTFAARHEDRYLRQFGSIDELMGLSIDTEMKLVDPLREVVDLDAAGRLQLISDTVSTLSFLRLHGGTAFCHTRVYVPPSVGRLLEDVPYVTEAGAVSATTVVELIDERADAPVAEADQRITVAPAPAEVAAHLDCPRDEPLLRIDRAYATTVGQLAELAVSYFLPERYSYRVKLRRRTT